MNIILTMTLYIAAMAFPQNLWAGPVYGAQWKRGNQTIIVYGDKHETYKDNFEQEGGAIEAFSRELNGVTKEILFLCEDKKAPPFCNIYSDKDFDVLFPEWRRDFIHAACAHAHTLSRQTDTHVSTASIDSRLELIHLIPESLRLVRLHSKGKIPSDPILAETFKKAAIAIKDGSIGEALERPIIFSRLFLESSSGMLKSIYEQIVRKFEIRKSLLERKITASTGLSSEEFSQITLGIIAERISDFRYQKLAKILANEELLGAYSSEMVEADALWQITRPNAPKKIVVIAGFDHILNLENYLTELGYQRSFMTNQNYVIACLDHQNAYLKYAVTMDVKHAARVHPLAPTDFFGILLYMQDIDNAVKNANNELIEEQSEAYDNLLEKQKIFEDMDYGQLIPVGCFRWMR